MAAYKNTSGKSWFLKCTNPENGKSTTIRVNPNTQQPFKSKKEAVDFEKKYLKGVVDVGMTFDSLIRMYLNDHLANRPSSSKDKVEIWYKNNIKPVIGRKKIAGLKSSDAQMIISRMQNRQCSVIYINKMIAIVKTVLNWGVDNGYLEKNGLSGVKPLKIVKNSEDIRYWTPEEMEVALNAIPERFPSKTDQQMIRWMLSFAYFTGFRKGEIRALRWTGIDFKRGLIKVDYHINEKNERAKGRKNGAGYSIVMDDKTRDLLDEMYQYYSAMDGFSRNAYVFPSLRSGFSKPIGSHTPTRWMSQLAEYCDLPSITFHGLRHSACSYWCSVVGLTPYEVADKLGDTVEVVLSVYAGFFDDSRKEVAVKLNACSHHLENL